MPRTLDEIPGEVAITDRGGPITEFFRLRWEQLRNSFTQSPLIAALQRVNQNAALATTALYTTISEGLYRVSYYTRKTAVDGVSSSLTVTIGWTESGVPQTESFAALAVDSTLAQQSGTKVIRADQASDITVAIAYASNTPGAMRYRLDAAAEYLV